MKNDSPTYIEIKNKHSKEIILIECEDLDMLPKLITEVYMNKDNNFSDRKKRMYRELSVIIGSMENKQDLFNSEITILPTDIPWCGGESYDYLCEYFTITPKYTEKHLTFNSIIGAIRMLSSELEELKHEAVHDFVNKEWIYDESEIPHKRNEENHMCNSYMAEDLTEVIETATTIDEMYERYFHYLNLLRTHKDYKATTNI